MRALFFGRKRRFLIILVLGIGVVTFALNVRHSIPMNSNVLFEKQLQQAPIIEGQSDKDRKAKKKSEKNENLEQLTLQPAFPGAKEPSGSYIGLQNPNFDKIVNPPGHKPVILIWGPQFGSRIKYIANQEVCGGDVDCDITYDKSKLKKSGALVFHYTSVSSISAIPGPRDPRKLYLWWTLEKNHGPQLTEFDNVFNLTFTYRSDSGIYAPYGSTGLILEELRKAKEFEIEPLLAKKRKSGKIAAWAVSNCGVKRRNDLVQDIIDNGLQVERFGRCYDGRKIGDGTYSDTFYEELSHYKFYMSLENGYHCKDYMTEKFWFNGLRSGAVPIVLGAKKEDVEKVAPRHSFIHVDDFPDVPSLVKYLKYLTENETAYSEYLQWRTWVKDPNLMEDRLKPRNRDNDLRSFCKLCRLLQEEEEADRRGLPRREIVVPSLHAFWWKNEDPACYGRG